MRAKRIKIKDKELLWNHTKIPFFYWSNNHIVMFDKWITENLCDEWGVRAGRIYFKDDTDITAFILRWL